MVAKECLIGQSESWIATDPHRRRQHRHPILAALPLPHDDLMAIEIEVLDAQIDALLNPHARPVEQHDHQPHRARELEHDVATNPDCVRLFSSAAVVTRPNGMPHPIEEL